MKNTTLGGITYTLKRSTRARAMRLCVYHDGRCIVTVPGGTALTVIDLFIQKKHQWLEDKINYFKKQVNTIVPPSYPRRTRKEYLLHREQARALVESRLVHFNQFYRLTYNRVSIKNTKSRWGSCSQKGNLNFSYKLALIPKVLADYVIVHELCHIKELNHSEDFWELVAQAIPNHREHRRALKKLPL